MLHSTLLQISYTLLGIAIFIVLIINYLSGLDGPGGEEDQDPPLPPLPEPPKGPITGGPTEDENLIYINNDNDAVGELLEEYDEEYNSDQPVCHDMQVV